MSEILSDGELREMESELCHYKDNEVSCFECNEAQRLISSHRALQAELDTLKAELGAAKQERDKAVERERLLRSYTEDCKKLIAEGREIIEGLKGFFPELMHLEKVKRFLKLSKEAQP